MNEQQQQQQQQEVLAAAGEGRLGRVQELMAASGPGVRDPQTGSSLLHLAARHDQLDLLLFLLQFISPNVVDREGRTPVHVAAVRGHIQVLRVLLADPHLDHLKRDAAAQTYVHLLSVPLFAAVLEGNAGRVAQLVLLGADPDHRAGPLVEGAVARELQVTTPRDLATALGQASILCHFPKKVSEEAAVAAPVITGTTPFTATSADQADVQQTHPGCAAAVGPDVYPLGSQPRGYVCHLSYSAFTGRPDLSLEDAHRDVSNLADKWAALGYTGHVHCSLTANQTRQVVAAVRDQEAVTRAGCLVIIVSGHGTAHQQQFVTSDMQLLSVQWLLNQFKDSQCPHLRGKPKLFIFDLSCGQYQDETLNSLGLDTRVDEPLRDAACVYSSIGGTNWYVGGGQGSAFLKVLGGALSQGELADVFRYIAGHYTQVAPSASPQLHVMGLSKKFYLSPTMKEQ